MDSAFVLTSGEDPPDRWRLTARTMMEFFIAESQTAVRSVFTAWLRGRPESTRSGFNPLRGDMLGLEAKDATP